MIRRVSSQSMQSIQVSLIVPASAVYLFLSILCNAWCYIHLRWSCCHSHPHHDGLVMPVMEAFSWTLSGVWMMDVSGCEFIYLSLCRKPLETLHRPPPLLISHNWGSKGNPKKPGKIHKEIRMKYIEEQGEIHKETRKNYLKKPERIT